MQNSNDTSSLSTSKSSSSENTALNIRLNIREIIRVYELAARNAILNGEIVTDIQDIAKYFDEDIKKGYSLEIDEDGEPIVKYVAPIDEL